MAKKKKSDLMGLGQSYSPAYSGFAPVSGAVMDRMPMTSWSRAMAGGVQQPPGPILSTPPVVAPGRSFGPMGYGAIMAANQPLAPQRAAQPNVGGGIYGAALMQGITDRDAAYLADQAALGRQNEMARTGLARAATPLMQQRKVYSQVTGKPLGRFSPEFQGSVGELSQMNQGRLGAILQGQEPEAEGSYRTKLSAEEIAAARANEVVAGQRRQAARAERSAGLAPMADRRRMVTARAQGQPINQMQAGLMGRIMSGEQLSQDERLAAFGPMGMPQESQYSPELLETMKYTARMEAIGAAMASGAITPEQAQGMMAEGGGGAPGTPVAVGPAGAATRAPRQPRGVVGRAWDKWMDFLATPGASGWALRAGNPLATLAYATAPDAAGMPLEKVKELFGQMDNPEIAAIVEREAAANPDVRRMLDEYRNRKPKKGTAYSPMLDSGGSAAWAAPGGGFSGTAF